MLRAPAPCIDSTRRTGVELSTDTGVRFLTVRSGRRERINFIVGRSTFLRFFGLAFTRACHHDVFRERGCSRHFCLFRHFYRVFGLWDCFCVHGPREIGPGRSVQPESIGIIGKRRFRFVVGRCIARWLLPTSLAGVLHGTRRVMRPQDKRLRGWCVWIRWRRIHSLSRHLDKMLRAW